MSRHGSKRYAARRTRARNASAASACGWITGPPRPRHRPRCSSNGRAGLRFALCARPRLPQDPAHGACRSSATGLPRPIGPFGHRAFADSAPVLEKALARNAGLGWIGKHTNLIDRDAGSYFFLGEIYVDLDLPADDRRQRPLRHLQRLPAGLPDRRDRRALPPRCAALHFLSRPSNSKARFRSNCAAPSATASTAATTASSSARGTSSRAPRARRTSPCGTASTAPTSSRLFSWSEDEFLRNTRRQRDRDGSAMSAGCGTSRWRSAMRPASEDVVAALRTRLRHAFQRLVREHVRWALAQHSARRAPRTT